MPKEREIIPVTNDVMFKALFTRNPDLLKSFLVAALNLDSSSITDIKIRNTELTPDYYEGKLTRLDILQETDGKIINIEMQVARKEDYKERVRQREKAEQDYYSDIAHAKAEGKAETYKELIAKWKAQGMTEEEIRRLLPTNFN